MTRLTIHHALAVAMLAAAVIAAIVTNFEGVL